MRKKQSKNGGKIITLSMLFLICMICLYETINSMMDLQDRDSVIGYYVGNKLLDNMPLKDNSEGLSFSHGKCNSDDVTVSWDEEKWAPIMIGLTKNKTKCNLYFGKSIVLGKDILPVESGDGLYEVVNDNLSGLNRAWSQTEYRYAGLNPENYVKFNDEIWRIIGLVNVQTESGDVEQRLKIIRQDGIEGQKDFGSFSWDYKQSSYGSSNSSYGSNDWTDSYLKDLLNETYYESSSDSCYQGNSFASQCNFNGEGIYPKGLNEAAKAMIDSDVTWNLGGYTDSDLTAKQFYEKERSKKVYSGIVRQNEWSKRTDVGNAHNGVGLMYPSDYGYAVGGDNRDTCLTKYLVAYDNSGCYKNNWLSKGNSQWLLTPHADSSDGVYNITDSQYVYTDFASSSLAVSPVVYLKSSVTISDGLGTLDTPFELILK